MQKFKRNFFVDLIRVISIFLVIFFHVFYEFKQDTLLRYIGFVGISLFFIASGFMLAERYPHIESFSIKWFFKRYVKIASLYYVALIFIIVLFGMQVYYGNPLKDIFYHFLFIDFLSSETAYSIISPAWFLVPLMGLYLLFPFLNRLIKKFPLAISVIFLVSVLYKLKIGGFTDYSFFSFLFFIGEFCFGILFSYNKKNIFLLFCLLNLFIMPAMIIPFVIFYLLSMFKFENIQNKIIGFIGMNTFVLFLFHESFMKVILGKWQIYSLGIFASFVILCFAVILSVAISKKIQKFVFDKFL